MDMCQQFYFIFVPFLYPKMLHRLYYVAMDTAQGFWKRVDVFRNGKSLRDLADEIGLNYTTLINQRSKNRYPSRTDMMKIAHVLGTTLDELLSDTSSMYKITPEMDYVRRNKRAEWIIDKCMESDRMLAVLYSFVECLSKEEI